MAASDATSPASKRPWPKSRPNSGLAKNDHAYGAKAEDSEDDPLGFRHEVGEPGLVLPDHGFRNKGIVHGDEGPDEETPRHSQQGGAHAEKCDGAGLKKGSEAFFDITGGDTQKPSDKERQGFLRLPQAEEKIDPPGAEASS